MTPLAGAAVLGALAVVGWQAGWFGSGSGSPLGRGSGSPLPVAQVPPTLPSRGVQLERGAIVLTPWANSPTGAISADEAVAAVRRFASRRKGGSSPSGLLAELRPALPATALPVEITLPAGWPPGSTDIGPARAIDHVPVWLVTFTSPKPIDASGGGLTPFYVTQFSEAVSPVTGKLVLGFETPSS